MTHRRGPGIAQKRKSAAVIGAGPAGLMAAEELARAGVSVTVFDAKPSVGRKFLMAGKSGLNLTRAEDEAAFRATFPEGRAMLDPMLTAFGPDAVQRWAQDLGQEVFTGSTGRVFPKVMKASPLLRAWLTRLGGLGVQVKTRWRWTGWEGDALAFETPDGLQTSAADVTVLALGGASWARLDSDGAWTGALAAKGVDLSPFAPSNAALRVNWSPHMARFFGAPVKGVAFHAADSVSRGEAILSARGLEGGGIYSLGPALRTGAPLSLDLMPDVDPAALTKRLDRPRGKSSLTNHLRKTLGLTGVRQALLQECARPLPTDPAALTPLIKALPVTHAGLAPMDEAISTAGGVAQSALTADLMLTALPGVFCAGEMLDWDAPTGGYLLTACLATGRWAGRAAVSRTTLAL